MSSSEKSASELNLQEKIQCRVRRETRGNMDNSPRPLEGKVYFSNYNNCKVMHLQKERLL